MQLRWFQYMFIALAVLAAQWAGFAHSIEHREHLEAGHSHSHHSSNPHAADELLHSCLLFDGLSTAQAATSNPRAESVKPLLASLRAQTVAITAPRNTLFAQRVRVRDPPRFS